MFSVDAPAVAPSTGGDLLDVANVITTDGYALFKPFKVEPALQGHNRNIPAEGADKTFDKTPALVESKNFTQYRGVDLQFLTQHGDGEGLLKPVFEAGEAYAVEAEIQKLVLSPAAVDLTPTPGTAVVNPRLALGLLEQYAKDQYTGQPVITGNALALTLVEDALEGVAPSITTRLSTPVGLAAGYGTDGPGTLVAGPGQAWLYISGQINIWKSDPAIVSGPDLHKNRELTLAEASYAVTVEGFVAAILVGTI